MKPASVKASRLKQELAEAREQQVIIATRARTKIIHCFRQIFPAHAR
jgi:hypothetical protein